MVVVVSTDKCQNSAYCLVSNDNCHSFLQPPPLHHRVHCDINSKVFCGTWPGIMGLQDFSGTYMAILAKSNIYI